MRRTVDPAVAVNSLLLSIACLVALIPVPSAKAAETDHLSLSQAIISYGFLRSSYPDDFYKLLVSKPALALGKDMKVLDSALDSLRCDVPTRLAFPHKALVMPPVPTDQWIGFARTREFSPPEGELFVTQPLGTTPQRILVVFTSVAPDQSTVFWLEGDYKTKLVYDSFKKGEISNEPHTMMGAVVAMRVGRDDKLLLEEWSEPGSRQMRGGPVGRVFQIDLARGVITIVTPGALSRPSSAR